MNQLPVNDGVSMEIVQCQSDLSGVHNGHVFIKIIIDGKQALYVTTYQILHHLQ